MIAVLSAAGVVLSARGAPPAAQALDGPGDPNASYRAGQAVDIYWGSSWWPGKIKSVASDGHYRIGYDGYASSWDEDVTSRRLRARASEVASPAEASTVQDRPARADVAGADALGDPSLSYAAGQVVDIRWGQRWWPGRVVAVTSAGYHVSYDGWSSAHDETVDARRLRRR